MRQIAEAGVAIGSSSMATDRTSIAWVPVWQTIPRRAVLWQSRRQNLDYASGADARVLLLAGDPHTDSHYLTARAFHNYPRTQIFMGR